MITPAFALTATERVLPKLALDFTTATLDSRVTFTRATSASNPATYVNSGGVITAATNNQPRFDFDPVTLACRGLLIEESRQNLILQSESFSEAIWSKGAAGTGSAPVVTPNAGISPDGTQNADQIVFNAGAGTTTTDQSILVQNATTSAINYTGTFWAKTLSGTATLVFRSARNATYISISVTDQWQRFSRTELGIAGTGNRFEIGIRQGLFGTINSTATVLLWGAQLEAGDFATSYIPTTTTALTRNADVAVMTGTNFSSWFNASEGSFMSLVNSCAKLSDGTAVSMDSGNTNFIVQRFISNNGQLVVRTGGSVVVQIGAQSYSGSGPYQFCSSYKADDFASATNGANFVTDTAGALPSVNTLRIGVYGSSTSILNGHIAKFSYWPMQLTDAEIVAFSKG